jgi:bacteriorhodopsin
MSSTSEVDNIVRSIFFSLVDLFCFCVIDMAFYLGTSGLNQIRELNQPSRSVRPNDLFIS